MKRLLSIMVLSAALLFAASCHKNPEGPATPAMVGEWQLSSISVKSVGYADTTVDVYLSFAEDGSFELYQFIGQGRFYKYTGTWEFEGNILSGKYSSGKAWGSTYEAAVDGEKLTLVSVKSGETDVYMKASIPDGVKDQAYEK